MVTMLPIRSYTIIEFGIMIVLSFINYYVSIIYTYLTTGKLLLHINFIIISQQFRVTN